MFTQRLGTAFERLFIRTGYEDASMDKDRARRLGHRAGDAGEPRRFPRALARFNYREPRRKKKGGVA